MEDERINHVDNASIDENELTSDSGQASKSASEAGAKKQYKEKEKKPKRKRPTIEDLGLQDLTTEEETQIKNGALIPIIKLKRDLAKMSTKLTPVQARYLVDSYYGLQEYRKSSDNQLSALTKSGEAVEIIDWLAANMYALETQIKTVLDTWSSAQPVGVWAKSICGIGPVLASGLLAYIDITKAPTAGAIWRFAGIDPNSRWLGTEESKKLMKELIPSGKTVTPEVLAQAAARVNKRPETLALAATDKESGEITYNSLQKALAVRPWNAHLKVMCWKIGESFVKVSNNANDTYGKIYAYRKVQEQQKNEQKLFASQAAEGMLRVGKDTEAYEWYQKGMLPPDHIHSRAKRYAVKLFLSAYHEVAYFAHYQKLPPKPYVIEMLNHVHYIAPPNMHLIPGLKEAHNLFRTNTSV
jgi:hypothetical protein